MLFALKGTNSIHSYDKDSPIQERKKEGERVQEARVGEERVLPRREQTANTKKIKKEKIAEFEVSRIKGKL